MGPSRSTKHLRKSTLARFRDGYKGTKGREGVLSVADTWSDPPGEPDLGEGAVHLWRIALTVDAYALSRRASCLSPDERARATRYHFDRDRRRFVAGRVALRTIVAAYLRVSPADVRFRYGAEGKPEVEAGPGFNLAHSEDLALCVLAATPHVGIDLEWVRPLPDEASLTERILDPLEFATWRTLGANDRTEAFYRAWTRKEAYLKARGEGLTRDPRAVHVGLGPTPTPPPGWHLRYVSGLPGFAAALAVAMHPNLTQQFAFRW